MDIHKKREKRKRKDEFEYSCIHCDLKFYTENLRARHENIYHGEYTSLFTTAASHHCSQCEEKFRHKGNLLRHQETHKPGYKTKSKETKMDLESEDEVYDDDEKELEDEFDEEEDEDHNES